MYKDLISVIVPVYNVKQYLNKCVDSILSQTHKAFELILVDDGSTDGSSQLCDDIAKIDTRIIVIHKENGGLSDARNTGTGRATGEWIAFIDSDDYIHPSYLEELYDNATDYGADVSVVEYKVVYEKEKTSYNKECKKVDSVICISGKEAATQIVRYNNAAMIIACGKLYHIKLKELINYPKGKLNEDEFVTYKILYQSDKVVVSTKKYYYYLQRNNSIMSDGYSRNRLAKLEALKEAITYFKEQNEIELENDAKLRYILNLQISWYRVYKSKSIQNKKPLLSEIRKEHKLFYRHETKVIKSNCGLMDKIIIRMYQINPYLYAVFSEIYLKINTIK